MLLLEFAVMFFVGYVVGRCAFTPETRASRFAHHTTEHRDWVHTTYFPVSERARALNLHNDLEAVYTKSHPRGA